MTVVVDFNAFAELNSDAEAITDVKSWNVEELMTTTSIAAVLIAEVSADVKLEEVVAVVAVRAAPKRRVLCALVTL